MPDRVESGFLGTGVSAAGVIAFVILLSVLGAIVGILFPQTKASAMLQVPREFMVFQLRDAREVAHVVDLQSYKRMIGAYGSRAILKAYLEGRGEQNSVAARRLLDLAGKTDFWSDTLVPVLPYSRLDQRRFGELKESARTTLIGLELHTTARTEDAAARSVTLLADYVANAWIREEIRAWILSTKAYVVSSEAAIQAEILRAEFDIRMSEQRAEDMKSIIARYPDAKRVDTQQVLSVTPTEGVERFFSPLMQLVGAESMISTRRERIVRHKREVQQVGLLLPFLIAAEEAVNQQLDGAKLMVQLKDLANSNLNETAGAEDWAAEMTWGVKAALRSFEEARGQMAIRTEVELLPSLAREPFRLAVMGGVLGVGLLGIGTLVRSSRAA